MSKLGGIERVRIHGNPGTLAGRKLGGQRSLVTHKQKKTGFKLLRPVVFPPQSPLLAELIGILAGDGYVGVYQTTMTTNSLTDFEHAQYTKLLFEKLFKVSATISFKKGKNACVVVVSSKEICRFLVKKGLISGHKIRGGLSIPAWIKAHKRYSLAFIKGVFDTDGCIYIDRHTIRGRSYENMGMAFTNRSLPLLADFRELLESLGLHPTQKTDFTVFLRRREDIQKYFEVVGSSNPKHLKKYNQTVPKRRDG